MTILLLAGCATVDPPPVPGPPVARDDLGRLVERLRDRDIEVRQHAANHLQQLAEAAVPALRKGLHDPDPEVATWCRHLLNPLLDDWTWYDESDLLGIDLQELRWVDSGDADGAQGLRWIELLRRHTVTCLEHVTGEPGVCPQHRLALPGLAIEMSVGTEVIGAVRRLTVLTPTPLLDFLRVLTRASGTDVTLSSNGVIFIQSRRATFDMYWGDALRARLRG